MINRIVASLALAMGFCFVTSSAEAFLTSAKAIGMGGAGVAFPQDSLATGYNPAGMVEVGDRMDIGLNWAHFVGHSHVTGNSVPGVNGTFYGYRATDFVSPDVGYNQMIGCDCRLSWGIAIYNRNQSKTSYRVPFVLLGTTRLGLDYVDEEVSPTLAYKLTDYIDVGISLNYHVQRLKVNGIQNFDNSTRSQSPGSVTNRGYNYSTGVGFSLGALWFVNDCLSVGVTYTPETHMGRFHKYKGFLAQKAKFNLPPLYSIGIAVKPFSCVTVAFDIQYQDWTRIRALHNPLIHDNTIEKLGSKNGPGFGFRAQTFYRVGVNWDIDESWTARIGYRHANTPVKPSQTVVNQLTLETLQDVLTTGGTWRIDCNNEISGYFAWGFQHTVSGKNSIPPPFGSGNADIRQQVSLLGLAWGYTF